ncbi:MFS transporter [Pleomorphomonas oryzae]|uniref:MFS transporter n=1 Tax=Pleomorphomonas oryzae TaxID=261934 RepID=UPI0004218150|nr:MFS transporter [Pleomorphomonas oryzae]
MTDLLLENRRANGFVLSTAFLDAAGLGMVLPVLPALIAALTGQGMGAAAVEGGRLTFVYAAMLFLFSPLIGGLSDRFGRRPLLILAVASFALDNLICALAPSLAWLYLGRLLSGISGSTGPVIGAYIADTSAPDDRARRFGQVGMAFGAGFVLGPALGGLVGELSPRAPFLAAALLAVVNAFVGWAFLKESLPVERRRPLVVAKANPFGALRFITGAAGIGLPIVVLVLMQVAHDSLLAVWTFSLKERFGWGEREIGLSLTLVGVVMTAVTGLVVGPSVKRFGEHGAAMVGLLVAGIGFLGFAFATSGLMITPFIAGFAFIGLVGPSLSALMSRRVAADRQGELQGAIAAVKGVTMALAPIPMTELFGYFTSDAAPIRFAGAPFLLSAVLMAAALVVIRIDRRVSSR